MVAPVPRPVLLLHRPAAEGLVPAEDKEGSDFHLQKVLRHGAWCKVRIASVTRAKKRGARVFLVGQWS